MVSVMLYPCILCVVLLMYLFVLCVACLTVFVNCLVKQFSIYFGVIAILLLNVMAVFSGDGGAMLDRPCMVFQIMCILCCVVCPFQLFCSTLMCCIEEVYTCHLKFWVVCIDGRRYVCCSECNVVSNECDEPPSCLVQPIGTHGGEVMYFGCVCFRGGA